MRIVYRRTSCPGSAKAALFIVWIPPRSIIGHVGDGSMDDDVFWRTITVDVLGVLNRLGFIR